MPCNYIVLIQRYPFFSVRVHIDEKDISAAKIVSLYGGGGHFGAASARKKEYHSHFPFKYVNEKNFENVVYKLNDEICRNYRN